MQYIRNKKNKLLKQIILFFVVLIVLISEKIFETSIINYEIGLLIRIQEYFQFDQESMEHPFIHFITFINKQYTLILVLAHIHSILYFGYNTITALKIFYVTYFYWIFLVILEMFYKEPQPFRLNGKILTRFYGNRAVIIFNFRRQYNL